MTDAAGLWFDDDAGPLVRPFAVTKGRTRPYHVLEMVTLVTTTAAATEVPSPEHREILRMCRTPLSVAEVAASLKLPLGAAKVLISDLVELRAVIVTSPGRMDDPGFDRQLIRMVMDGVRRL